MPPSLSNHTMKHSASVSTTSTASLGRIQYVRVIELDVAAPKWLDRRPKATRARARG